MSRKPRNYKSEYQRRIVRGQAKGLSRSQARGHPRASEIAQDAKKSIERRDPREWALRMMKKGLSQREAARRARISVERLRAFMKTHTTAKRYGRTWVIQDDRPQSYWVASDGQMKAVILRNDDGTRVGHYWNAVNRFLPTNKKEFLDNFESAGVRSVEGKYHPFETRPNVLRMMDSIGELTFIEIYADVAK